MDFYNQPFNNTYRLERFPSFKIPRGPGLSDNSYATVITVSANEASYWVIAYTIVLASIFGALAKLVTGLVLAYAKLGDRGNRHVMLAAYYNSESQLTAAIQMVEYAYHAVRHSRMSMRRRINWDTLRFASILASIAIAHLTVAQAAKFVVGHELVIRPIARANPDILYYPNLTLIREIGGEGLIFQLIQPLRVASVTQAVGRAQATKEKLEQMIHITTKRPHSSEGPTLELNYSYTITGEDLGLQLAHRLNYSVSGKCKTRYDWIVRPLDPQQDEYGLWGNSSTTSLGYTTIPLNESQYPPWIRVVPEGVGAGGGGSGSGFQFTIIPYTSHRLSPYNNTNDPWYITEDNPDPHPINTNEPNHYRVRRGRPPMFCWQNDTYSLGNDTIDNVDKLGDLHGLLLSPFLNTVLQWELKTPPIVQIANNLGYSSTTASVDSTVVISKSINATRGDTEADLRRLLQITYVSSREIVRNIALLNPSFSKAIGKFNAAEDHTGRVPYQNADFLLDSKDVAALSVLVLITVPCICAFLWTAVWIRMNYGHMVAKNTGPISRQSLRFITFHAPQLYRFLTEEISGRKVFSGRTSLTPFIRDIEKDGGAPVDRTENTTTADEHHSVSVAGAGVPSTAVRKSAFVKPKLVKVNIKSASDTACKDEVRLNAKTPLMTETSLEIETLLMPDSQWKSGQHDARETAAYELAMTLDWEPELKPDDGYVHAGEIINNI